MNGVVRDKIGKYLIASQVLGFTSTSFISLSVLACAVNTTEAVFVLNSTKS